MMKETEIKYKLQPDSEWRWKSQLARTGRQNQSPGNRYWTDFDGPTLTRAGHADRHQVLFLRQISGNRSSDYQNRRGVRSYSRRVEIFLLALLSINAVIGNPTEAFHPLPRGQSHCFRCCDLLRSQQRLDTFLPTT